MKPTSNQQATELLKQAMPNAQISISGDGYKYKAQVISADFIGKNIVARHKMVYQALNQQIVTGNLHALEITALTPDEAVAAGLETE